jgi:hypothetical protein
MALRKKARKAAKKVTKKSRKKPGKKSKLTRRVSELEAAVTGLFTGTPAGRASSTFKKRVADKPRVVLRARAAGPRGDGDREGD